MNFADLTSDLVSVNVPQLDQVEFLAGGGQKRVFRCEFNGEPWALKVALIRDENVPAQGPQAVGPEGDDASARMDSTLARAEREVSVLSECDSPHVVKRGPGDIATFTLDNLHLAYWLEELVDGEDLSAILLRETRLPVPQVVSLGIHVAHGIEALWSASGGHQIVHRDINPRNIMRRENQTFVIIDPGLALDLLAESLTDFGAVPGTLPYMSPEQLDYVKKRQMDYRSDMFSLGITMYEAATGRHPYFNPGTTTRNDLMRSIVRTTATPPVRVQADVGEGLSKVIMRMMAKRPHFRYRTCEQLRAALEALRTEGEDS